MSVYPGRKGVVYISTSKAGVASAVLKLNKWNLDQATDKIDVTSFLDTNKTYVQGLPDVKGSFGGFWDDQESKPFQGARSADGIVMYIYPSADAPSKFLCGPAWLDVSMSEDVSGAVEITGNFVAAGSWAGSTI